MGDLSSLDLSEAESFSFLFSALWEVDSGLRRVVVNIPDTILYKDGVPHRWLFTSEQTGEVMKKKTDKLIPSEIVRSFKAKSRALRGFKELSSRSCIATVWYMTSTTEMGSFLVDDLQLETVLQEACVLEILAIQVFLGGWPDKASGIFEHHFWLRKNSTIGSETFELACVARGQNIGTFSRDVDRLVITDTHHESCKTCAARVIKRLELVARSKVANVVLQIVFNSSSVPFVVGARSLFMWDPPILFSENRSRFCFVGGVCPQVDPTHRSSRVIPRSSNAIGGGESGSTFVSTVGGGVVGDAAGLLANQQSTFGEGLLDATIDVRDLPDYTDDDAGGVAVADGDDATAAAREALGKPTKTATFSSKTDVFASMDSEEPISPHYAPPIETTRGASNIQYSDIDLPFRSSKLELGRLNGMGRRPLSASASGVYYPNAADGVAATAAAGKTKRASNLLASLDMTTTAHQNGTKTAGGGGLEFVRTKAPLPGHRAHCEQMTESYKTRLHYYTSQLKEVETLPIEAFLRNRRPISAPHVSKAKGVNSKTRNAVPLGGHGVESGGRRSTGLERKLPCQSGTVCFGDYCGLTYLPDVPDLGEGPAEVVIESPAVTASKAAAAASAAAAGPARPESDSLDVDSLMAGGLLGSRSMPALKPATKTSAFGTADESAAAAPEVERRPELLNHALPFRSILLARAEEAYNGVKLWAESPLDLESGQTEYPTLNGGAAGLTELAQRHLKRVGKACLTAVRRIVHHSDEQSYSDAWDAINKEYRNQVYADALSKVHPSRFYFTVPLCDQCWKLYGLLDHFRESVVFGVLNGADGGKSSAAAGQRRSASSSGEGRATTSKRAGSAAGNGSRSRPRPAPGLDPGSERERDDTELLLTHWREHHDAEAAAEHELELAALAGNAYAGESLAEFVSHNLEGQGQGQDAGAGAGAGLQWPWSAEGIATAAVKTALANLTGVSVGISTAGGSVSSWVRKDGPPAGFGPSGDREGSSLPPMPGASRPRTSRGLGVAEQSAGEREGDDDGWRQLQLQQEQHQRQHQRQREREQDQEQDGDRNRGRSRKPARAQSVSHGHGHGRSAPLPASASASALAPAGQGVLERLGRGVLPQQQRRAQAAPLGNMLSQRTGNHGGERDVRGARNSPERLAAAGGERGTSRTRPRTAAPASSSAISRGGGGGSSGGGYSGSDGGSRSNAAAGGALSSQAAFSSFASGISADAGLFPTPYPGPGPAPFLRGLPEAEQPFLGGGLVDITAALQPQAHAHAHDLLSGNNQYEYQHQHQFQFQFSTLPYSTAPHFPLPTLSLASDGDFSYGAGPTDSRVLPHGAGAGAGSGAGGWAGSWAAGSLAGPGGGAWGAPQYEDGDDYGWHVDALEMPMLGQQSQRQHAQRSAGGPASSGNGNSKDSKGTSARERAKNRVAPATASEKPVFEKGWLGGLDLNAKIKGFDTTYGGRVEKLVLGKRHDGR